MIPSSPLYFLLLFCWPWVLGRAIITSNVEHWRNNRLGAKSRYAKLVEITIDID